MKKSFLAAGLVAAVFIAILSGCARSDEFLIFNNPEYITSEEQTLTFASTNSNGDYYIQSASYVLYTIDGLKYVSDTEAIYDEASGTFSTDRFTVVKQGNDIILHVTENESQYLIEIIIDTSQSIEKNLYGALIFIKQLPQGMTPDEIE